MITSELFGTAPCGTPVHHYTLNGPEICVRIMDYGATVLGIDVPDIPGTGNSATTRPSSTRAAKAQSA